MADKVIVPAWMAKALLISYTIRKYPSLKIEFDKMVKKETLAAIKEMKREAFAARGIEYD